ncbi:MAG: class I SAM-dependent methyltransferase [Anaerolineae bacterium]
MKIRFGQAQRLRAGARRYGPLADLYLRIVGTTSPFALNCYWLLRRTLRHLDPRPRKILDAGCGKGDFTFAVADLLPEADVLGVDASPAKSHEFAHYEDNIEVCNELNEILGMPNVRFEKRDLMNLDESGVFDFIFCIHVLEHIEDNEVVLQNLAQALKPGGYLYVQMPSRVDLSVKFLEAYLGDRLAWEKAEHIGLLTRDELVTKVDATGLEVLRATSEFGYLLTLAWQGREALVQNEQVVLGAALFPVLKLSTWLHRILSDRASGLYRRLSLRLTGAPPNTEGNLELLARKPVEASF